ncbi:Ig-like domain-containing protein [Rhizobium terrae]|uniref:Ig-like domain-containing protein n=1 Tax=Rhizobium terrae TaxID=2171756 RepID=UPI000E3BE483|nr:Ig-like domain-containing protein [Rhizobium terrae]
MSDATLAAGGVTPVNALLMKKGSAAQSINLTEKFGAGYTFSVKGTHDDVVATTVDSNGILTLTSGDLGHSDIRIIATAPDGSTVSDDFRVRVAGENAYTIAVLPDTQDYTDHANISHMFGDMTQWLVDNKDSLNIQFVTHVGDVTQHNYTNEWAVAEEALRKLDGKIAYSILPGNHDLSTGGSAADRSVDNLSKYFTVEEQSKLPGFGGVYDKEPNSFANNFATFTAPDGTKWLSLSLEFGPRDDVLRWAGEVIEDHLDYRVMITTHGYMAGDGRVGPVTPQLTGENAGPAYGVGNSVEGASDGDQMWDALVSKYPNISFVFSGHNFIDGAETQVDYGAGGQPVFQMLVNYQNGISREITGNGNEALGSNGGNGAIRLLTIDPDNNAVYTETYFTNFDDYLDGYRVKEDLDRNGLTGYYRGHQEEFHDVDMSAPVVHAFAKAGHDLLVDAGEDDLASVTLDASSSIIPTGTDATYTWKDADGKVLATGAKPTLDLTSGSHVLTLEVSEAGGHVSVDQVRVTVKGVSTLLVDNFNDGNSNGWSAPTDVKLAQFGTPADFNVPAMSGGDAEILSFPKYTAQQYLKMELQPAGTPSAGPISSYTFVMDVLIPNETDWFAFFQTNPANTDDAEFYLENHGNGTGGLGISERYHGNFKYGEWQRVAFSFEKQADTSYVIKKYIDGVLVGQQTDTYRGGRFDIDPAKGVLLFSDDGSDTSRGQVNSVLFSDRALTAAEIAGFGKADADGISSAPIAGASQFDFTGGKLAATWGPAKLSVPDVVVSTTLKVVGTVKSGEVDGEGVLKDLTNSGTNILVWNESGAKQWSEYVYDVTLSTNDNSGQIGAVFHYQDQKNYYRVTFDVNGNARTLVKVQGGVETVLATVAHGIIMGDEVDLRVVVTNGEIRVMLNDKDVFNGPVTDPNPLAKGTVGIISKTQDTATFDNVTVNKVTLTAHGEAEARAFDMDGDGVVQVTLHAGASFGTEDIISYRWLVNGVEVATGKDATFNLPVATKDVTLEITDSAGKVATDLVKVDLVRQDQLLMTDDFSSLARWRLFNEGENGVAANWHLENGKLVQNADVRSQQLTNGGNATSGNLWDRGWSPLGDGDYILRKGAYALYMGEDVQFWKDYSVEVDLIGGGNDVMGLMFYYQDPKNYYKVELDSENGLFQLTRIVDGIESILARTGGRYAINKAMQLRVDIKDHVIDVTLDGEALFENKVEDHSHNSGSFALYNWSANGGVSYDNVRVVSLETGPVVPPTDPEIVGTGGNDVLIGTEKAEIIIAAAGDDVIQGLGGNDKLFGDAGADAILGGLGDDKIDGGAGDDTLIGNEGNDEIKGGDGADLIDGSEGNDVLTGGNGSDSYIYSAGSGSDTIVEGTGQTGDQDRLFLDDAARGDVVIHRHGSDIELQFGAETVTLRGQLAGGGIEVISFADGTTLVGSAIGAAAVNRGPIVTAPVPATGNEDTQILGQIMASDADGDQLTYAVKTGFGPAHGAVSLDATTGKWNYNPAANYNGADSFTVVVSDGHGGMVEQVVSLAIAAVNDGPVAVDDTGFVLEKETKIFDLIGNDQDIDGNPLSLTGFAVEGVAGFDLSADAAKAAFAIVDGKLTFTPGTLFEGLNDGETATVTLSYTVSDGTVTDSGSFTLTVNGEGRPQNVIIGTETSNVIIGTDGDDAIAAYGGNDYTFGQAGADVIDGGEGNDYIFGGVGNDVLNGGDGNDTLFGDAGNDYLIGDKGNDRLTGGAGADTFVFRSGFDHDTVMDFGTGDVIELSTTDFADFSELSESLHDTALGTELTLDDGSTLTITDVDKAHLTADHFHFAA